MGCVCQTCEHYERERDHANCAPGCNLHPQVHYGGWVWNAATSHWHYFCPGMAVSECGRVKAEDSATRRIHDPNETDPGAPTCHNCRRVIVALNRKLRGE